MNSKILLTASVVALMSAAPAFADTAKTEDTTAKELKQDMNAGVEKTEEVMKETADDVSDATKEAYREIKAFVFGENDDKLDVENVKINAQATASAIIGEPVYNSSKERIGVVKDVILDESGKAMMVVVGDGDFFGLGKLAAFEYDSMVRMNADGDIVMPITEEAIERAAEFSYDGKDAGENVKMMPASSYSVEKLMDAHLVNLKGEDLGEVEDITFNNGQASQLVVGFGKILGLGGEEMGLPYDSAKIIQVEDEYEYQLSGKKGDLITNYEKK